MKRIKFRGISLELLTINANRFNGCGFSLLTIELSWKSEKCTTAISKSLLFVCGRIDHDKGGKRLVIVGGLLFMHFDLYTKVLMPEKDECDICGDLCQTKEFYNEGVPCCCAYCNNICK